MAANRLTPAHGCPPNLRETQSVKHMTGIGGANVGERKSRFELRKSTSDIVTFIQGFFFIKLTF